MVGACSAYGGGRGVYTGFWWRNLKERIHLIYQGVDSRIILKLIFRKWDKCVWTGSIWLRKGQVAGTCECCNESSGSKKYGEFLD
jgi:hypothetical protein